MKILIIIASPRKQGNTFEVAQIISNKLKEFENLETELLFLADANLALCKGCCACLTKGENYCPVKDDDIKTIEEKILSSDGVVFLSPVYAMNMTALMKNFMDRFAFSMHRPRFFNQYTMIGAVTGCIGLKETIQSISQIKYCGFNIVQTFGIVAASPLLNLDIDEKAIKKIEKATERFYKKISKKAPMKPSFATILQFKAGRNTFKNFKDVLSCDYEYFKSKDWFNIKRKYYVDNAKINFWKNIFSDLLLKIM